ncbi:hypothetical protein ACEPAI_7659 [Sanghuangporus weigelae]
MFPYREDRVSSRGTRNSGRGILETLDWNHKQELGRGSFGVVYKIQWIGGHSFRAVKCIRRTRTQDADQEWRVLEHLGHHKNIIKYYSHQDVILDGATHLAIELEYMDGSDLVDYMWSFFDNNQSLPSTVIARLTSQILAGLMHMHSNGYAHCDIKPDNIMLTKAFEVKIADFGLATYVGNYGQKKGAFGTISYLGPECYADDLQGFASDMWALGVTVFNMSFMGHDPFHTITKQEIDHRARRFLGHPLYGTNFIDVQRKLIFEHFSRKLWPIDIDTWSRQHRDGQYRVPWKISNRADTTWLH